MIGLLSLVLLSACQDRFQPRSRIAVADGESIDLLPAPETASVALISKRRPFRAFCSAFVIDDRHALTAAHCLGDQGRNHRSEDYYLLFDDAVHKAGKELFAVHDPARTRPVRWHRVHEAFHSRHAPYYNHDIAMIRFDGGLPSGVQPAQLAEQTPEANRKLFLIGLGQYRHDCSETKGELISDSLDCRGIKRFAEVDVQRLAEPPLVSPQLITKASGESRICFGDSGGLLAAFEPGGVVAYGIHSSEGRYLDESTARDFDGECKSEIAAHAFLPAYRSWIDGWRQRTDAEVAEIIAASESGPFDEGCGSQTGDPDLGPEGNFEQICATAEIGSATWLSVRELIQRNLLEERLKEAVDTGDAIKIEKVKRDFIAAQYDCHVAAAFLRARLLAGKRLRVNQSCGFVSEPLMALNRAENIRKLELVQSMPAGENPDFLKAFKALQEVNLSKNQLENCAFLSSGNFPDLRRLDLSDNRLNSIECLRGFAGLQSLNLLRAGPLQDLAPLQDLSFTDMQAFKLGGFGIPAAFDLSTLAEPEMRANLQELILEELQLSGIESLKAAIFPRLLHLKLGAVDSTFLQLLSSGKFPVLQSLALDLGRHEASIAALFKPGFTKLRRLTLNGRLRGLDSLLHLPELKELSLRSDLDTTPSYLSGELCLRLESLSLAGRSINDLQPLAACDWAKLRSLAFHDLNPDLSMASFHAALQNPSLTNLESLSLLRLPLKNFAFLESAAFSSSLTFLSFAGLPLENLASLRVLSSLSNEPLQVHGSGDLHVLPIFSKAWDAATCPIDAQTPPFLAKPCKVFRNIRELEAFEMTLAPLP